MPNSTNALPKSTNARDSKKNVQQITKVVTRLSSQGMNKYKHYHEVG